MTKFGSLTAAALLVLSLHAQDAGVVRGVVVNSVTGAGVGGAIVRLDQNLTVTNESGIFSFSGLKPGQYQAIVQKSGFATTTLPPIVRMGEDPVNLRLELQPMAALPGHVFGPDGKPAQGIRVEANGERTFTRQDGSFMFAQLRPGVFILKAYPLEKKQLMENGTRQEIVPTYFPSETDFNLTQQIRLLPGGDQGGYDIRMQSVPVFRIRGVVLGPGQKPAPNAAVELLRPTSASYGRFVNVPKGRFFINPPNAGPLDATPVQTDKDGAFEFSVPAADWTLFSYLSADAVNAVYGSSTIRVGGRDVEDLRVELEPRFELTGSFVLSDGSPDPQSVRGLVTLIPEDGGPGATPPFEAEKGKFVIKNVRRGRYWIRPEIVPPANYYAAAVMLGSADVTGQPVDLSPSSPPLSVIVKPGASIRGSVENGAGATVLLWPATAAPGDADGSVSCDTSGNFEFTGLAPGDYYAMAAARPMTVVTSVDVTGLRQIAPRATTVRVEDGSTASVQLRLTPDF